MQQSECTVYVCTHSIQYGWKDYSLKKTAGINYEVLRSDYEL